MNNLKRIDQLLHKAQLYEITRRKNLQRLKELYDQLGLDEKIKRFEDIFTFNAINVVGISLQKGSIGTVQSNRYVQIVGIKKGSKNINLKYYGKSDQLPRELIYKVCEFILAWRLEKSFRHMDYCKELLEELDERKNEMERTIQSNE